MTAFAEERLAEVLAPQVVGVPPINAIHDLMMTEDGEIRHYGFIGHLKAGKIQNIYLSSRDFGFSWQMFPSAANSPGATVRSPWSGDYLTVLCKHGRLTEEEWQTIHASCPGPGIYVHRSSAGPDGPFMSRRVGDVLPRMLLPRQPLALRSRKRWLLAGQGVVSGKTQQGLIYLSDDDGESWRLVVIPPVPEFGVKWPNAGPRWENCGSEPTVAELSDGSLYMLLRTAQDEFWESRSSDGGETWTTPGPSRFYGTITTPLLFKMSDGRLLAVWNNTTPLPEMDHRTQHGLTEDERNGVWEDLFTNRDVVHAAISEDDGKTWVGFREILLNVLRNNADFRAHGGNDHTLDKSVHQSQALELPGGRILLAIGQHNDSRRFVLFDPNWLHEMDRREDFGLGLDQWSVHQYFKSVYGNFRGFAGHCAANRRPGPAMIPHPDGEMREVLQVARHRDPRLLDDREGAVWNFPAGMAGKVRLHVRMPSGSGGTQITLVDRWFNPTDPVVGHFAQLVLRIGADGKINGQMGLVPDRWHWLTVRWDLAKSPAGRFCVDDGPEYGLEQVFATRNGISYVHIQSAAAGEDVQGILIDRVEKTA